MACDLCPPEHYLSNHSHTIFFLFKFFCLSDGGAGGGYLKEEK